MNKAFKFCLYGAIAASGLATAALSNPDVVNNIMPPGFSWLFAFLSLVLIVCAGTVSYLDQELEDSEVRVQDYMERYERYYSQSVRLTHRVAELERKDRRGGSTESSSYRIEARSEVAPLDFDVVSRQGWNADTLLTLAEFFLKTKGLLMEFEDYLEGVAADENEECAEEET